MAFRKLGNHIQANRVIGMFIDKLRAEMVSRNMFNYVEAKSLGRGSSYDIPGRGDVTVQQYDGTPITPEDLTDTVTSILMDRYPFSNYYLEKSDPTETEALNMAKIWTTDVSELIGLDIDADIFKHCFDNAATGTGFGITTAPVVVTSSDTLDFLENVSTVMKEANVKTGVNICIPEFMGNTLVSEAAGSVNNDALAGRIVPGFVTSMYGMDIYTSNNMPIGIAGGLAAGEYGFVVGRKSEYLAIEGYTHFTVGDSETKPANFNQLGQVYGRGFKTVGAWRKGVIAKA